MTIQSARKNETEFWENMSLRTGLKGVFLIIVLLFFLSAGADITAHGAEIETGFAQSPWHSAGGNVKEAGSLGGIKKGYYASGLKSQGKKYYKALLKKNRGSSRKVRVALSKPVTIKTSRSAYDSGKIWKSKKVSEIDLLCEQATIALIDSNPDFFWIRYYKWSYYYYYRKTRTRTTVRITAITFKPVEWYSGAKNEFQDVKNAAKSIASMILQVRTDTSAATTAMLVYSYLADTVTYDTDAASLERYSPAGALLEKYDHLSVCDGYSRAFKMICDECGVTCLYVGSTYYRHAWNMVRLDDGQWYGVDVTWGDGDSGVIDYRWCLYGQNLAMPEGQHPVKAIYVMRSKTFELKLPELASVSYAA